MKIQSRHYDRILLIELEGPVTEPDLVQVATFINPLAAKLACVVVDVHTAQLEPKVASILSKLKSQYEKNKVRFLIVSAELMGADSASLANAVGMINSTESARILEIFDHETALKTLQKEVARLRLELIERVGLKETAEAPLAKDEITRAIHVLEEKNRQLLHLFKTLSSEIHHLSGNKEAVTMPGSGNPIAVRVAEVKRRVLEVIKSTGVLK